MPLSFGSVILKEKGKVGKLMPRQVDKKYRGPQGERGQEFSRMRKGET